MSMFDYCASKLFGSTRGSDELLVEQYHALRRQIPLMYAIICINGAFLGSAAYGHFPLTLSVGMPAALLLMTIARAAIWLKRRDPMPAPPSIRRYLRSAILVSGLLSLGFGGWGLMLLDPDQPIQMFAVALYIFVGAIGCCYCLQFLPTAGRLVLLFGTMPVTARLMLSGNWYLFGIAANFLIVAVLVGRSLSTNHERFISLLDSRADILAEQDRARLAEQKAQALAFHDSLTGLQNRRALTERLDGLRVQGAGVMAALLILDLDQFKAVNDVHGHAAGDRLLRHVAERLAAVVGPSGRPYRLGGDEFAVALEFQRPDRPEAGDLAERIVTELARPFQIEGLVHHISASIGLSVFPDDAVDSETLVRRADIALYKAKARGRSRCVAFEAGMDAEITQRSYLESDLRRDLPRGAFRPWYQPIVNLASGQVTGFEMLARWHNGKRLRVGPDQFIPIAEECGLVGELMLQLLEQSCRDAVTWEPDLVLSVNVSPTQLKDRSLSARILEVLARTGLPPSRLKLEITENALISEPENAKVIVGALKSQGVRLALDDFGTGYSSIQHLRILPFDNIKIDRSFILDLEEDREGFRMVQAMVRLASSLDLPVVAEGIERQPTLDLLKGIGCAEGQGFLFGKPMEATEIAALLGRERRKAKVSLAA